ncbi:hypothetical protein CAC42_7116 [Sphaceloma murrayae]|uniref:RRM domain-containing protein n=1 Tax=Sphaceloma murrayae TaxID=2082308 RepID=A0A2K1QRD8_9PEZI|nr:hypothetical protein CAC42_7116 [Sphaceloma murrayae]
MTENISAEESAAPPSHGNAPASQQNIQQEVQGTPAQTDTREEMETADHMQDHAYEERPQQTEPTTDPLPDPELQEEKHKRKRRSPSPAPSDSSVKKRLRQASENLVHLPEDAVNENAQGDAILSNPADGAVTRERWSEGGMSAHLDGARDEDRHAHRSVHPPTTTLYIRNLVRPLQPSQLQDHILTLLSNPSSDPIARFHLSALRDHAFIQFTSSRSATLVRALLHDTVFPPEPTRRTLFVDFLPPESLQPFIDLELSMAPRSSRSTKWEVIYETLPSGRTEAHLVDASTQAQDSEPSNPLPRDQSQLSPRPPTGTPPAPPVLCTLPLSTLYSLYPSTTSQPSIFFASVAPSLAAARLRALEDATRRDWDPVEDHRAYGRAAGRGSVGAGGRGEAGTKGEVRRYTFDEARVVDGGAEFGGGRAFRRAGGEERGTRSHARLGREEGYRDGEGVARRRRGGDRYRGDHGPRGQGTRYAG